MREKIATRCRSYNVNINNQEYMSCVTEVYKMACIYCQLTPVRRHNLFHIVTGGLDG